MGLYICQLLLIKYSKPDFTERMLIKKFSALSPRFKSLY